MDQSHSPYLIRKVNDYLEPSMQRNYICIVKEEMSPLTTKPLMIKEFNRSFNSKRGQV